MALFFAQGATGLVAAWFLPLDPSGAAAPIAGGGTAVTTRQRDATAILRRNIFDSETGPLDGSQVEEVVAEETEEPEEFDPNAPLPNCEGSMRLVGSLVSSRNPEWSFASISGASGTAEVRRIGDDVDGKQIIAIHSQNVVMRPGGGNPCQLAMFAQDAPATPARPAVSVARPAEPAERPATPTREGAISSAQMDESITRVSDTQFTIARSLVDSLLENQAEMMRTARIIPHEENGQTVGVKLYGIRRNSLLGRLGLQNGDMLRTINGYDMTSPDSALEAYARLRSAERLSVSVVRRGQPSTIEYNIQ